MPLHPLGWYSRGGLITELTAMWNCRSFTANAFRPKSVRPAGGHPALASFQITPPPGGGGSVSSRLPPPTPGWGETLKIHLNAHHRIKFSFEFFLEVTQTHKKSDSEMTRRALTPLFGCATQFIVAMDGIVRIAINTYWIYLLRSHIIIFGLCGQNVHHRISDSRWRHAASTEYIRTFLVFTISDHI